MENQFLEKYNLLDPDYGMEFTKSIKISKIEQPPKLEVRIAAHFPKNTYPLITELKNFKYIGCVQALEIFEDDNFLTLIYPNVLPYTLTQEKLELFSEDEKLLIVIQLIIAYQEMQKRGYGWVVQKLSQLYFYDNLLQFSLIDVETFIENNDAKAEQKFKIFLQFYFSDVLQNFELKLLPELLKQLIDKLQNFEDEEEFFRKTIMKKKSEIIYKGNSFIRSYIIENEHFNKVMFPNWPAQLVQKTPIIQQKYEEVILKNVERELQIFEKFNFKNQMVQLLAYFRLNKQIIFVMKKYDGSLDQLIEQWEKLQQLPQFMIYQVCLEVCSAVAKLHENGVIHRDIKPLNFLYEKLENGQYSICVADFDRSKIYQKQESVTSYNAYLTPFYDPPENDEQQTPSYDIWQVGLVLLKIASKNTFNWPIGARKMNEIEFNEAFNSDKIKKHLEIFNYRQNFTDLIIKCLQKKPQDRPTSQQITDKMREIIKASEPKIKIIKRETIESTG